MKFFLDTQDKRLETVKKLLIQKKFLVFNTLQNEKAETNDVFVFAPSKKWTESEISSLPQNIHLFCGKVENFGKALLEEKKIIYHNFLDDEKFAIENANLTAEGVLCLILEKSQKSIFKNNILLFGFGRITKACSILFSKLGLKFSIVTFNKENFDDCYFFSKKNFLSYDFLREISCFDIIINTRPTEFLDVEMLKNVRSDAIFLETASKNSIKNTENLNFSYIPAPALPLKYCCESAGKIIFEKLLGELNL